MRPALTELLCCHVLLSIWYLRHRHLLGYALAGRQDKRYQPVDMGGKDEQMKEKNMIHPNLLPAAVKYFVEIIFHHLC